MGRRAIELACSLAAAWLAGVSVVAVLAGLTGTAHASDMAGSFSIILRDPKTGEMGIAAYSHAPACGAWVPWVDANVGAVITQGDIEASWGPRALAMLAKCVRPEKIVDSLRTMDPGNFRHQLGMIDRHGWPGGYTGPYLVNWSGGWLDSNLAVQGNTMTGHEALDAVVDTLYKTKGKPIAGRLLGGLVRAHAAKVDFRGARSAVLVIGRPNRDRPQDATRYVDLRVDDADDPIRELEVQYANWRAGRLVGARLDDAARQLARRDSAGALATFDEVQGMVTGALADSGVSAASLNAMAWALARRGAMLADAWTAVERARRDDPHSNEYADTEAEIRLRQGRVKEAHEIERAALKRVPLDEYLQERVEIMRKQAGLPPDSETAVLRRPPPKKR